MNNAKKEIAILKRINHPNLIKLHSVSEDSKNVIKLFYFLVFPNHGVHFLSFVIELCKI